MSSEKHIFLDRRPEGLSLYLYGDLQFDERDERFYHVPLAWAPVALAVRRFPSRPLRVLILGGGDGLALREVLRFPQVREVQIVDLDPAVLRLGRGELSRLNERAFEDPRVTVHVQDARDFLSGARGYSVAINDFTYPRDASGSALFTEEFFRRERASLENGAVVGVNAVSPERSPAGFSCVGATLRSSGFEVRPFACDIPSFRREGYGAWGCFLAATSPLGEDEVAALAWPEGTAPRSIALPGEGIVSNRGEELLRYLRDGRSAATGAPRGAGAQGFAEWLKAAEGRRSLEDLLLAVPLDRRDAARDSLLELSGQAERIFQGADLKAFVDALLSRARRLPKSWARELRALRARLDAELPPARELLTQAYRVFAIFMIVLLLANLFFPDNLYAKGSSGGHGGGGEFSYSSHVGRPFHFHGFRYYGRVYDSGGRSYAPAQLSFSDPTQGIRRVSARLALTSSLQLMETGAASYAVPVADFKFYLEPGRLRVLDADGHETLSLAPPPDLEGVVRAQVASQKELVEKAIPDHERWLHWIDWASFTDEFNEDRSELNALKEIKAALDAATALWATDASPRRAAVDPKWIPLFPGVYLSPATAPGAQPQAVLLTSGGGVRTRSFDAVGSSAGEDRFLLALWQRYKAAPANRPSW